jgi:hypothetical protein
MDKRLKLGLFLIALSITILASTAIYFIYLAAIAK